MFTKTTQTKKPKMKRLIILVLLLFTFIPSSWAIELPSEITLKTDFRIWEENLRYKNLTSEYQKDFFGNLEIKLLEGDRKILQDFIETKTVEGVDVMKIKTYLEDKIAPAIYREKEDVIITEDEDGEIIFEGNGLIGRILDSEKAAFMVKKAIDENIDYLSLPLIKETPTVTVESKKLKKLGIKELVAGGETNFSGSPYNRRVNIAVGLSKFDGEIIEKGEEFSFGQSLGRVDESTGYREELVIKGDQTIPEYGGGLCQVSTTAYRGVLAAGLPVTERRNHSYAVRYYLPHGLDATVYDYSPDLKFINDTPGALLMQTFTIGDKAYWNYYGTKDDRRSLLLGPWYSDWKEAPEKRIEYSEELEEGEIKEVGHAVPGFTTKWYRQVLYNDEKNTEKLDLIKSKYQARPDYEIIGKKSIDIPADGY